MQLPSEQLYDLETQVQNSWAELHEVAKSHRHQMNATMKQASEVEDMIDRWHARLLQTIQLLQLALLEAEATESMARER